MAAACRPGGGSAIRTGKEHHHGQARPQEEGQEEELVEPRQAAQLLTGRSTLVEIVSV